MLTHPLFPDRQRELEEYLSIFVCDEINFWLAGSRQAHGQTEAPRELVLQNVLEMVKRARLLSCKYEIDKVSLFAHTAFGIIAKSLTSGPSSHSPHRGLSRSRRRSSTSSTRLRTLASWHYR